MPGGKRPRRFRVTTEWRSGKKTVLERGIGSAAGRSMIGTGGRAPSCDNAATSGKSKIIKATPIESTGARIMRDLRDQG